MQYTSLIIPATPPQAQPKSHSPTYRRRAQHDEYGGIEYAALPVNYSIFVITLYINIVRCLACFAPATLTRNMLQGGHIDRGNCRSLVS
jgi:hypothetical protein